MRLTQPWEVFDDEDPRIQQSGWFSFKERVCYEITGVLCQESPQVKEVVCPKAASRMTVGMAGSAPAASTS